MDHVHGINAEDMARVDEAIEELASWPLPLVWIGEPDYDEDGHLVGPKLTYYQLEEHRLVAEVAGHNLPRHCEMELWEETVLVLAARKGLVSIRKLLPTDKITDAEALLMASISDPSCKVEAGYYHGVLNSVVGREPRSEDWVTEDTVIVFDFSPDRIDPNPSAIFYRFVPSSELTSEDLPYIEDFLCTAEEEPHEGYSIPATPKAKMAWMALSDKD